MSRTSRYISRNVPHIKNRIYMQINLEDETKTNSNPEG